MTTFTSGSAHFGDKKFGLQTAFRYAVLLGVGIAISLLAFVAVNAVVDASAPLLAEMRIQSAINGLNQDRLTVQRQQAMRELENANEGAVPALLVALHSGNPTLRRNAAEMLGFIASPLAIAELRSVLINDPTLQVRQKTVQALGEIQNLSTLDALQGAAVLDKSRTVRLAAADSIARFRTRLALAAGVNEQDLSAFATAPGNSMVAYLALSRDLTRTYDGGKSWQTLAQSLPSLVTTLAVSPLDSKVLFASADGLGLFKSTDGGTTWAAVNTGLGIMPGARFSVTAIAFDPTDSQRIFVTTGVWIGTSQVEFFPIAVMRSIDGGATWQMYQKSTNIQPITQLALRNDRLFALAGDQVLVYQVGKVK